MSVAVSLANASDGLYLPPAPSGSGGEDSIATSTGARCSQSMNSNGAYLDVGVAGYHDSEQQNFGIGNTIEAKPKPGGLAYARVTIPLSKKPERLDCSKLYELELQRLREELQMLKMNIQ